ncbi:uncharacterized protein TA04810 [Theileria annulata]|uniref:Uncharacterized protein n=1 Tax=Theileria annulata TaxID=5874 RepID=Q4UBU7_THEAN|nr:uncharacterized protein TA04810 [Theileria annulata]CAI75704.1 hypothetical protein, conserved [Theileria annulata]|eukprot:XP_955180.1 hypothetical protein, conserved [Theileria annulata]
MLLNNKIINNLNFYNKIINYFNLYNKNFIIKHIKFISYNSDTVTGPTDNTKGKRANGITGKGANSTAMECTPEETPFGVGGRGVKGMECNTKEIGTVGASTVTEEKNDRNKLYLWQLKIICIIILIFGSSYFIYTFINNDMDIKKTCIKLSMNWDSLFYNISSEKFKAFLNSRFYNSLSNELNYQISLYFFNIDINKENGFRKSDAIYFLTEIGIDNNNKIIQKFISNNSNSNENKLLNGCTLNEFGNLIESLILEQKLKSNEQFETNLLQKLINLNQNMKIDEGIKEIGNTLIIESVKEMYNEVKKYMKENEEEYEELESELERNKKLKMKLEQLSKSRRLNDQEKRHLTNINREIVMLNNELNKLKYLKKKLLLI